MKLSQFYKDQYFQLKKTFKRNQTKLLKQRIKESNLVDSLNPDVLASIQEKQKTFREIYSQEQIYLKKEEQTNEISDTISTHSFYSLPSICKYPNCNFYSLPLSSYCNFRKFFFKKNYLYSYFF